MLYTLLLAERYGVNCEEGLLFYLQSGDVWRVNAGANEIRGLIMSRNEVVAWGRGRGGKKGKGGNEPENEEPFLPPTIDDVRICGRCYAVDTCMLYRKVRLYDLSYIPQADPVIFKAIEGISDTSSPIAELYTMKTGHLSPKHAAFFQRWERLVSLEEEDVVRFRRELWTMGSKEREDKGRCIGGLVLVKQGGDDKKAKAERFGQFVHRFTKRGSRGQNTGNEVVGGSILAGDPVTISVDCEAWSDSEPYSDRHAKKQSIHKGPYPRLLALVRGFVLEILGDAVVVALDHRVDDAYVWTRMGPEEDRKQFCSVGRSEVVYRLDKDELTGGVARIRDNLAQMFYVGANQRRLELIVDLTPPVFAPVEVDGSNTSLPSSGCSSSIGQTQLNANQQQALLHILRAEDYALVLGMPGTGKTTTVAELIRVLVRAGKTVLLTSYTHSAVDTILRKLVRRGTDAKDEEIGVLRLGNVDKVR